MKILKILEITKTMRHLYILNSWINHLIHVIFVANDHLLAWYQEKKIFREFNFFYSPSQGVQISAKFSKCLKIQDIAGYYQNEHAPLCRIENVNFLKSFFLLNFIIQFKQQKKLILENLFFTLLHGTCSFW